MQWTSISIEAESNKLTASEPLDPESLRTSGGAGASGRHLQPDRNDSFHCSNLLLLSSVNISFSRPAARYSWRASRGWRGGGRHCAFRTMGWISVRSTNLRLAGKASSRRRLWHVAQPACLHISGVRNLG